MTSDIGIAHVLVSFSLKNIMLYTLLGSCIFSVEVIYVVHMMGCPVHAIDEEPAG